MGVRGLWQIVGPVARPVRLESLSNKKLAIDASIWIYHFLKAVRDSKGNALANSHIIGFFRRICKLLYFGIKPVFVFDGDAPVLKRKTIRRRKERKIGSQQSASQTASKLLTIQLQKLAEDSTDYRLAEKKASNKEEEEKEKEKDFVYYDERNVSADQRTMPDKKIFRPTDQYHLPEIDENLVVDINDPRLMTEEELEEYAKEFQNQIATEGLYDTSTIDFESPQFETLPIATQYQLLNTARLRSRLRMGYTAEQLEEMFPDRMQFSKFQIERVTQRNFFTQRLMGLMGLEEDLTRRIVGEKGGEYMLKRNENGWSMVLNKDNDKNVIDLNKEDEANEHKSETDESDVEWENVELEQATSNTLRANHAFSAESTSKNTEYSDLSNDLGDYESVLQRQKLYKQRQMEQEILDSELFGNPEDESESSRNVKIPEIINDLPALNYIPDNEGSPPSHPITVLNQKKVSSLLFGEDSLEQNSDNLVIKEPVVKAKENSDVKKKEPKSTSNPKSNKNSDKAEVLPPWFVKNQLLDSDSQERNTSEKKLQNNDEMLVPYNELGRVIKASNLNISQTVDFDGRQKIKETDLASKHQDKVENISNSFLNNPTHSEHLQLLSNNSENIEPDKSFKKETVSISAEEEYGPNIGDPSFSDITGNTEKESSQVFMTELSNSGSRLTSESPKPTALTQFDRDLAAAEALYDEEEDEELLQNISKEMAENERFAQSLSKDFGKVAREQRNYIDEEIQQLKERQKKELRDADSVTTTMVSECQELLRRFGIPYITAPMEAEAQCAKLIELGLVDGIVTDDSDCFLFGGTKVYKNMFNQSKYVEQYDMADLEREFALDRKKLVKLAYLLGSDYTDGLPGVGPVTALELLSEFPSENGLVEFKQWWKKVQTLEADGEITSEFRKKFKKNATKLQLSDDFPDLNVEHAYFHPQVDDDPTPFEWGVPNLDFLRGFLQGMTGWGKEKIDELLIPVIQTMNQRLSGSRTSLTQATLSEYVGVSGMKKVELGSKRMYKAMTSLVEQKKRQKRSGS